MNKFLDSNLSTEVAQQIKSKAKQPFDNAYKAVLTIAEARYTQGFLVYPGKPYQPIEHAWVEVTETTEGGDCVRIVDPTFPHLQKNPETVFYFAAHTIKASELQAIIEESQEDYPEDDPLPIYGDAPYEYYGDVMLGGKNYLTAYEMAMSKCRELNQPILDGN
ncbi:hypothetical protein [Calothrix sp. NIES-3974]|uniref:hypothetical protein n=1 Tax=Calothrix sp. NIES-3974 TaxID=2005462 RepID=UPI000B5ECEB9|nr:hypothetical protein [Calothrix sp. NIES-3974]BAZ07890.1 hypothetical protein NIES3974_45550 [Calothrix sp. NIES-3974]